MSGQFMPGVGAPAVTDDEWYVCCSDDEKYTSSGCPKGRLDWAPPPEEMGRLLAEIDAAAKTRNDPMKPAVAASILNLDWKCPGRRPPTPTDVSGEEDSEDDEAEGAGTAGGIANAPTGAPAASMDFEFNTTDEIAPSGTPLAKLNKDNKELRGSARKKTSDLNSILNNMQRHRRIDQMATGSPAAAASKSKPTPRNS